ncbi:thioredoxin domain-containing protein [Halobellus limi]|uniref:Uncharacterized protein n=1 Tax=Halobellus limi TaxID=699433 RepID=A0A1H5U6T2_9EURY|nr:hypothetical protein [Halobellus limi]QCC47142.1 hypothetical protein DV707_05350 [Halobellus limi]SEF70041.1 hypothetical protein SAMN04488133_0481 [Halobellus limi]
MVEIAVYDDPLNPTGWGMQPALRRLRIECPDADWRRQPVVMVPDWDRYDGPEFPGGRRTAPATCLRIAEETGMPIDEYLWFEDAPDGSRPACVGIEQATDPGTDARSRLFRAAREATFLRQTNLDTDEAVRGLLADALGPDAAGRFDPDSSRLSPPDLSGVDGVETVGDRPVLPAVVVSSDSERAGRSGRSGIEDLRTLVTEVGGAPTVDASPSVETVVRRFSPEGWLCGAELSALTGRSYGDAVDAAAALSETVTAEFAAETFVRLRGDADPERLHDDVERGRVREDAKQ